MSLGPGVLVGSYEVVSLLGAGGMGEVYRPRDPLGEIHVILNWSEELERRVPTNR